MSHGLARGTTATIVLAAMLSLTMPARADEKADRLIAKVVAATRAIRSLTADFTIQHAPGVEVSGLARLEKPNLGLAVVKTGENFWRAAWVDGKTYTMLRSDNTYSRMPLEGRVILPLRPLTAFFDPRNAISGPVPSPSYVIGPVTYVGRQVVNGRHFDVLETHWYRDGGESQTLRFYIDRHKLITRMTISNKFGTIVEQLRHIRLNAPVTHADVTFPLPKTAKLYTPPDRRAKLIPVGQQARKFDLPSLNGGRITFDEVAHGSNAVLLSFWKCAPAALTRLQALYSELKDKGLAVIAINGGDSDDAIQA